MNYLPITCPNCSVLFTPHDSRQKYCNIKCKIGFGVKVHQRRMSLLRYSCTRCAKEYTPTNASQKFCGKSCALSAVTSSIKRTLICVDCKCSFEFVGRTKAKRCLSCRHDWANAKCRKSNAKLGKTKNPGVGSGGAQIGESNHRWNPHSKLHGCNNKMGYDFAYRRNCYKYWPRHCAICSTQGRLDVHHINGDPADSAPWNLIPLCRKCHMGKVHKRAGKWSDPEQLIDALGFYWPEARVAIKKCQEIAIAESKLRNEARNSDSVKHKDNSNRSIDATVDTGATHSG